MTKNKKWIKGLFILLLCMNLTGCLPTDVVDDIFTVQAIGFEDAGDHKILGTVVAPIYAQTQSTNQGTGAQSQGTTDTFSAVSHSDKEVIEKLQTESQQQLKLGKLTVILINDTLAKKGIEKYLDYFNRDPHIGRNVFVAIVDGSTRRLLDNQYASNPDVSRYLFDLIQQNIKRNFPVTNLHEYFYDYYGKGINAFLPVLKKHGDHIEIEGIGLIKHNRYIGLLPFNKYAFIFKILNEPCDQGTYAIKLSRHNFVTVKNIGSKVKYKVRNGKSAKPEIFINVNLNGIITEASVQNNPQKYIKAVSKVLKKDLENKGKNLTEILQKRGVDPLGLGDQVRSYTRNWNEHQWYQHYPDAKINVNVKVNITQTGITE
ncbi:spore germination protein [Scopulibacillus daqui]|uniref:Spore germination protein n=1 Tax=Scopulibacillus daqui TaxID=1469162 RepID=A0ABS2Q2K9_9BACL|nr:Ger(x)C family spore germination protein [Scopulibacillus daqui]MBM7646531.1 spore germination protein [Scopulibacillus daqui]